MCNRQIVKHGVGGAAGGHDDGNGVFDGLFGHDVARFQIVLDGLYQHTCRFFGAVGGFVVRICHRARKRQAHAQGFKRGTHGVGGVHAAAGAAARNGAALNLTKIFLAHVARSELAHGFEHANDVEVLAFVAARQNRSAVDINGWHIGPQHAHHAAGHVFVAAPDHQNTVHPLTADAGFNAIGNHFTRHQAVLHALGTHGHAIGNRGGAKNLCVAARCFDASHRCVGQFLQTGVARCDGGVPVGDANHGLFEIARFVTEGVVHRAVWSASDPFGDVF